MIEALWGVALAVVGFMGVRDSVLASARWRRVVSAVLSAVVLSVCAVVALSEWDQGGAVSSGAGFVVGVVAGLVWYARAHVRREHKRRRGLAGVFVVVALASMAIVFALSQWLGDPKKEKQAPAAAVEAVGCRCSVGAVCVGPRGGLYCIADDGKKRYKGK